jgi:hypothetical protein
MDAATPDAADVCCTDERRVIVGVVDAAAGNTGSVTAGVGAVWVGAVWVGPAGVLVDAVAGKVVGDSAVDGADASVSAVPATASARTNPKDQTRVVNGSSSRSAPIRRR